MASIATMALGAIFNATAFIGGSLIAKSFSTPKNSDAEIKRQNLATEKYNKDWQIYQKKKEAFEDWQYQREKEKNQADSDFQTTHQELDFTDDEPNFSKYYQPNDNQKIGELLYVGGGMLGVGYLVNKWF